MAKKRKAWLHVGVAGAGDVIEAAVVHHRAALVELGVASAAHTPAEGFRAAVEMTRSHRTWGLKRGDVEGQWVRLVRRAEKARTDIVFSQGLLAQASAEQIDLVVDALTGFQIHVVVTSGLDDEAAVLDAWSRAVRRPERLHVLETDGLSPQQVWKAFGAIVGFGTSSLALDAVPSLTPPLETLPEALRELERLARRNASLEVRLEELDRKRRKLKRRLAA